MASIKKRGGKKGVSYLIRVSCGYTPQGIQVVRNMTWRPAPGMTERQIQKELARQVAAFEAQDLAATGSVKFEDFSRQWFKEVAAHTLRPRTLETMHNLLYMVYPGFMQFIQA